LAEWRDKNGDGIMQYAPGEFDAPLAKSTNELRLDNDIIVLASPEIAKLPHWVIGLIVAGGLAAALSTAAGLLLVIAAAVSHDLLKSILTPNMTETQELLTARLAAAGRSLSPACSASTRRASWSKSWPSPSAWRRRRSSGHRHGIFNKQINVYGAMTGMIVGIVFTAGYILWFAFMKPGLLQRAGQLVVRHFSEGIGTVGAALNFLCAWVVSKLTPEPPMKVQELVMNLRYPGKSAP